MHDLADRYRQMQNYVGWTDDDARRVTALRPLVSPHAHAIIEDFYREIERHPEAARVITGGTTQINRLSRTLREWLAQLLAGQYDELYMERRWRVGYRHVEIGLPQRFTSLALARLRASITSYVYSSWTGTTQELSAALESLNKLLDLDHALIQDAYEFEHVSRERLRERTRGERKFRHLVENASCLIIIVDARRSAIYINPYAEAVTDCTAEELRANPSRLMRVFGSDEREASQPLASVLAGHGTPAYEVQIISRGGAPRWISWTLSPIDNFEGEPAVLAVGHDVTERRTAEARLLQSSRLATVGEMYARLAHESRNSLQRMRVSSELLADRIGSDEEAAALIERSIQAQSDLQHLLDEVRNYASPIVLEKTECRLPALWREAWGLLHTARAGRQVELIDNAAESLSRPQLFDRFRMVQVFRNVFENCLAASCDPLTIHVDCRERTLGDDKGIEVHIRDNGPGFSEAALYQAFEPFYTTRSKGTGLGLAIVRRIVEGHGGTVRAENSPHGGAVIVIALPAQDG